ncbi:MAG TPA: universal stress protein [Longimicrobium sp.]|nr:universal stress protein [Longimicrobium sp.]
MRSILAVSDLTPGSDAALSTAACLAGRTGAALHLVHAMEIVGMPLWEAVQTDVGRRIRDAEGALAEQLGRALPDGCVAASCVLHFRSLHAAVPQRARDVGAGLVVLGTADRGSPGVLRMQALANAVAGSTPTLLVHAPLDHPPRRALLPLSAAEAGTGVLADACDWLTTLADPGRAELRVLHVASGPRQWRQLAAALDDEVRWAGEQRQWFGTLRITRGVRWSVAADEEILNAAAETAPDLVVLGPGCGVADSSVCARDARVTLLGNLPCPVLLLPGTLRPGEESDTPSRTSPLGAEPFADEPGPAAELAAAD